MFTSLCGTYVLYLQGVKFVGFILGIMLHIIELGAKYFDLIILMEKSGFIFRSLLNLLIQLLTRVLTPSIDLYGLCLIMKVFFLVIKNYLKLSNLGSYKLRGSMHHA